MTRTSRGPSATAELLVCVPIKVIDFGTNRKRVFISVVNGNLDPILHRFRDTAA